MCSFGKNKNYQNLLIFHAYEVKWKGMDVFYISYTDVQIVAPQIYSVSLLGRRTSRIICHWLLVFYGVVCWTCLFTIISCMFNLMIIMCSPEIVSAFVHVFDLKFLHFNKNAFNIILKIYCICTQIWNISMFSSLNTKK